MRRFNFGYGSIVDKTERQSFGKRLEGFLSNSQGKFESQDLQLNFEALQLRNYLNGFGEDNQKRFFDSLNGLTSKVEACRSASTVLELREQRRMDGLFFASLFVNLVPEEVLPEAKRSEFEPFFQKGVVALVMLRQAAQMPDDYKRGEICVEPNTSNRLVFFGDFAKRTTHDLLPIILRRPYYMARAVEYSARFVRTVIRERTILR